MKEIIRQLMATAPSTRDEVLSDKCQVPKEPGLYGWWFRSIPGSIDASKCLQNNGLTLLYTGISPSRPPKNGKSPSRQNLRKRIVYHYRGNAEGSTLRLSLGVLLSKELDIKLRWVGSGKRMTFGPEGEAKLSEWMSRNAYVSWVSHAQPWEPEDELIAHLDLPINLQGNSHNRFYSELKRLRKEARDDAEEPG
jgi:hypothetical protein